MSSEGAPFPRDPWRVALVLASVVLMLASIAVVVVRWPAPLQQHDGGSLGAGLAFRCVDTENCWTITAVPQRDAIAVFRTVDGKTKLVKDVGVIGATNRVVVEVAFDGDRLEFFMDGELRAETTDPTLADAPGSGLAALAETSVREPHWTDFTVTTATTPTRVDRLRGSPSRPLGVEPPSRWRAVSGVWIVSAEGAHLGLRGPTPLQLALLTEAVPPTRIAVTLTGIR